MQLALFDFDHTITHGDSYAAFLRRVATPAQWRRARWQVAPWLLGYKAGLVSAARLRRLVTALAFTGRDAGEIAALGREHAIHTLPGLLRRDVMQRLDWHQQQGHEVVLVSASLEDYLAPWCRTHGLDGLICNTLEREGSRLTGRYAGGDIGRHKAALIRDSRKLEAYKRIHAYGDSREDRPMLALAHERWYAGRRLA